ncbi:hypothetical protein L195_g011841 [Trifolium pratense]|uniref:Uncharacterized protein n=1 Tax=Trifolium pratense TaxID=57577 RepID=A0A2K3P502_TRIPR|nr:hypothetical protein L195_g006917 [Trifolium pratense]PNY15151.1 hypothetical protein L195_g011841 [Trifolium pratense]
MQGYTMPMVSTSENLVINQLPQPTRPYTVYLQREDNTFGHPQQSVDQFNNHVVPPTKLKVKEEETKFVLIDKLGNRVLDKIYEKLPAKLREEIHLEEVLGKEGKRGDKSECSTSRDVGKSSDNEKLGRFKIRTVVAEEVVKGDEKK